MKVKPIFTSVPSKSVYIDYRAHIGDVILFPSVETSRLVKRKHPYGYDYLYQVIRNGKPDWLLVYQIKHERNTYDLSYRFRAPMSIADLLTFLGDLECPITVNERSITW